MLCWIKDGVRLAVEATRLSAITSREGQRIAVVEASNGELELELSDGASLRSFPRSAYRAVPPFLAGTAERVGLIALIEEQIADTPVYWIHVEPRAVAMRREQEQGGAP